MQIVKKSNSNDTGRTCNRPELTGIVLLLLFAAPACGELNEYDSRQIESAMRDTLLTTNEIWDVSLMLLSGENRRMILEGDYAIVYNELNRDETVVRGAVYVQIFDSTNSRVSEAWSQRAVYKAEAGEFELFDSVRVSTRDSTHIFTDYLQWSQASDMISTNEFITIMTPSDSTTGTSFRGRADLTEWELDTPRGRFVSD